MSSEVLIAAAGGGKTTSLAEQARSYDQGRVAIVTYTINNVQEIRKKLYELNAFLPTHVEIWSWYTFLLHEMARPYQSALLDRRIDGLHWVEGRSVPYIPHSKTSAFFLSKEGHIYSDKIARFTIECDKASGGRVIARLQNRFQSIFIDEVQDMAGYDLDLLELVLRSNINLVMYGDHRQATYKTNNAAKNHAYSGVNIVKKFREWEKSKHLVITYNQETYRCNQRVADFADSLFPTEPRTISRNKTLTGHDGVFIVSTAAAEAYIQKYRPQILRLDRRTKCNGHAALNFGESKGMTFDRVLIFPHVKCQQWLTSGRYKHIQDSSAKIYVGITRARHSAAFVFDGDCGLPDLIRYA